MTAPLSTASPMSNIDFAALIEPVARKLLGDPNRLQSSKTEWRFGSRGSLSIEIAGPRRGQWFDHEAGVGGGVLDLISRETGHKNGEALAWLRSEIGADFNAPAPPRPTRTRPQGRKDSDRNRQHAAAAELAGRVVTMARSAGADHPYLARKRVSPVQTLYELGADELVRIIGYQPKASGEPLQGRVLIVPVHVGDAVTTVEMIDEAGRKSALAGGRKGSGSWLAQPLPTGNGAGQTIAIGEGVATVLSVAAATGWPVAAALSCGNLKSVAEAMRRRFPAARLVVLADLGNGEGKAHEATVAAGAICTAPTFDDGATLPTGKAPTDWNDLAVLAGPGAVGRQLETLLPADQPEPQPDYGPEPPFDHVEPIPLEFTDDSLALEFSRRHGENWRFVAPWGKWFRWAGTHWEAESTLEVFDLARAVCRDASNRAENPRVAAKVASAATVAAVERLARADRRHAGTVEQWDADLWLLNTPAGVVDLHTGKMRRHRPDQHLTKITAVAPGGNCPNWIAFLDRVTAGDEYLQAFLQRVAGYSLTGSTRDHALFFPMGPGATARASASTPWSASWATTPPCLQWRFSAPAPETATRQTLPCCAVPV